MGVLYPNMEEHQIKDISYHLSNVAHDLFIVNDEGLALLLENAVKDLEAHRNMFQEHILFLQKNSKQILEILKSKSLVYLDADPKTKKNVLKGRTSVLTEVVVYMNILNDMVISYYKDVYKVEQNTDRTIQSSLF
jgi:hypothetical protein